MHNLYRYFDKDGNLLYVGVSINAISRLSQHKRDSHWFDRIIKIEIEQFSTKEEALAAEIKAILQENPSCNLKISLNDNHNKQIASSSFQYNHYCISMLHLKIWFLRKMLSLYGLTLVDVIPPLLESKGITQADIAENLNVTQSYVSQVISGKKDSRLIRAEISDILGFDPWR